MTEMKAQVRLTSNCHRRSNSQPGTLTLQEAGISVKLAPTIGIAVDHRRRNRSLESLQVRSYQQGGSVAHLSYSKFCETVCLKRAL